MLFWNLHVDPLTAVMIMSTVVDLLHILFQSFPLLEYKCVLYTPQQGYPTKCPPNVVDYKFNHSWPLAMLAGDDWNCSPKHQEQTILAPSDLLDINLRANPVLQVWAAGNCVEHKGCHPGWKKHHRGRDEWYLRERVRDPYPRSC